MEQRKIEQFDIEEVKNMSITQIRTNIGKAHRMLVDEYGMSEENAQNFMVNIMMLSGAAAEK